jgi:hypothetical protein
VSSKTNTKVNSTIFERAFHTEAERHPIGDIEKNITELDDIGALNSSNS